MTIMKKEELKMLDMNLINKLSTTVSKIDASEFLKLYNELTESAHTDLASIVNGLKVDKLQQALASVAMTGPKKVSKWDRQTPEGRAANCEASKKSVAKRKEREAAEAAELAALRAEVAARAKDKKAE